MSSPVLLSESELLSSFSDVSSLSSSIEKEFAVSSKERLMLSGSSSTISSDFCVVPVPVELRSENSPPSRKSSRFTLSVDESSIPKLERSTVSSDELEDVEESSLRKLSRSISPSSIESRSISTVSVSSDVSGLSVISKSVETSSVASADVVLSVEVSDTGSVSKSMSSRVISSREKLSSATSGASAVGALSCVSSLLPKSTPAKGSSSASSEGISKTGSVTSVSEPADVSMESKSGRSASNESKENESSIISGPSVSGIISLGGFLTQTP